MQIHDLTNGKYAEITSLISRIHLDQLVISKYGQFNRNFLLNRYYLGTIDEKQMTLLQEVPVFFVDRELAGKSVQIPGTEVNMQVPLDRFSENVCCEVDDDPREECLWRLRELNDDILNQNEPIPPRGRNIQTIPSIVDMLGVYVTIGESLMIKRIYVWIDKVLDCASHDQENAHALLEQVILHEYAHALLDVELYEFGHTRFLTYTDYLYRYIEEACANAISLALGMDSWSKKQKNFIENFVKSQPVEYAAGWDLYRNNKDVRRRWLEFWMQAKVHVGRNVIDSLGVFWRNEKFKHGYVPISDEDLYVYNNKNIFLVKPCGNDIWTYGTKENSNLLGLIRIADIPSIICKQKYKHTDSFEIDSAVAITDAKEVVPYKVPTSAASVAPTSIVLPTSAVRVAPAPIVVPRRRNVLRVTFVGGPVIQEKKALETLRQFVITVGVMKVQSVGIECCGVPLVSNKLDPRYKFTQKPVGGGWYLFTNSSTDQKKLQIERIANALSIDLKVEIV